MMGFGMLMMLLVFVLPILLVAAILIGLVALLGKRSLPVLSPPTIITPLEKDLQNCAHCGQALQVGWSHCPNCGAPTAKKVAG